MNYTMVIDTKKCLGCMACVVACETENNVPTGYSRDWIKTLTKGKAPNLYMEIRSERCNHCARPPSVYCCPTGASHVVPGGIVVVDKSKCTGCKACVMACPYNARYVHPEGHTDKCTFCYHRVIKGKNPACVDSCPSHAMYFGDADDPKSTITKLLNSRKHKVVHPEYGTQCKVFYLT